MIDYPNKDGLMGPTYSHEQVGYFFWIFIGVDHGGGNLRTTEKTLPPEPLRFKHVGDGLEQVELGQKMLEDIAVLIRAALEKSCHKSVSQNEIARRKEGEFVRNHIKMHNRKVSQTDIDNAIIHGLKIGMFYELEIPADTKTRKIICVQKQ